MRELFERLKNGGEAAINKLVAEKMHETVELEFKTKSDPSNGEYSNDDKKNLAKELSALSNSMGGLLVWGIVAKKDTDGVDRAVNKAPITNIRLFKSRTLTLVGELLVPKNEHIQIEAIETGEDSEAGYLLMLVGRSERRPHRSEAKDQKQYFKRSGDSSYAMEHFDIEDAFKRVSAPELLLKWELESGHRSTEKWHWRLLINLFNDSQVSARFPYLNVKGLTGGTLLQERGLPAKIISGWHKFYGRDNEIVHPDQHLLVFELEFWIRDSGANEWRRSSGTPIQFSYQCGALDCRMRSDYFEIENIELVEALRKKGANVRFD